MTVLEYCAAERISRSTFYAEIARGEGVETYRRGSKVLISPEARRRQRARLEQRERDRRETQREARAELEAQQAREEQYTREEREARQKARKKREARSAVGAVAE
jgi:hypothetical protein